MTTAQVTLHGDMFYLIMRYRHVAELWKDGKCQEEEYVKARDEMTHYLETVKVQFGG